jgi:hypothetical protein
MIEIASILRWTPSGSFRLPSASTLNSRERDLLEVERCFG